MYPPQPPFFVTQRSKKPVFAGILLIISALLGFGTAAFFGWFGSVIPGLPTTTYNETGGQTNITEEEKQMVTSMMYVCGGLVGLFSFIALIGSIYSFTYKSFWIAVIGSVFGILAIGFIIGAVLSFIALILVAMSKNDFGIQQPMPAQYPPPQQPYIPPKTNCRYCGEALQPNTYICPRCGGRL